MDKNARGERGFALIELLVVLLILSILAAIAIPVYLGQREKAEDAAAKSAVRSAMVAIESAYVDSHDFTAILDSHLVAIETSVTFIDSANASTAPTADAAANEVNWRGTGTTTYEVGSASRSGKTFGVVIDKGPSGGNTFYVDGGVQGW
jgi:type IV pilus assembly protein PilA